MVCRRSHVTVLWYNLDIIVATILFLLEDVDRLEHFEIYFRVWVIKWLLARESSACKCLLSEQYTRRPN